MPTATGLRISAVDGTAFLDNCPADILAAVGIGAQIKIYDSSNRMLRGVLKAAGTSETLGGELITALGNHPTHAYETLNLSGTDITSAINSAGSAIAYVDISASVPGGKLFKLVNTSYTLNSGQAPFWGLGYGTITYKVATKGGVSYGTATSNNQTIQFYSTAASSFSASGNSGKQVLTPSSSGVIIKDLSGNQNFISKDASFTYNEASYTYEILQRKPQVIFIN